MNRMEYTKSVSKSIRTVKPLAHLYYLYKAEPLAHLYYLYKDKPLAHLYYL